jgi:hypothetical protein
MLVAALVLLLSSCQSVPPKEIPVSPDSSVLGVGVAFPVPLSRDPVLTGVVFLKEPRHGQLEEATDLIPASWIKGSRAYLLNAEPGTYLVVAVFSAVSLPSTSTSASLGGGVTGSVSTGGAVGQTVILPAAMIQRTRTVIGPSRVEFAGALQIGYQSSDRINASTEFEDELQRWIAELVRPGVTSKSGLAGQFTRTWMANPTLSSTSNEAGDRESFLDDALADFGNSPWVEVIRSLD